MACISCCNNEVIDKSCGSKNSSKVVWSISSAKQFNFNSFILLERYIQRKRVHISSTVPECNETVRQLITENLNITEKALGIGQEIYLLLAYNCATLDMIKNGKDRTN